MPTISRFYGIIIFMNFNDHVPPHFHARYQEFEVTVGIGDRIVQGRMPARALGLVLEWAALHHGELSANWDRARNGVPLQPISPLV